ncbi:GntR family transcriptional regulator [Streptomyces malaysiensis]|uniref:GntR family transcriptional regulator n=1 Tax=Streptomyces malaysiensis TaxID=92644 RepID=UPI00371098F8
MAALPPSTQQAGPALPTLGGTRRSYRERVADALRAALIAGELRAGEVYSAPTLAARFGVSSTPVREAMLDLVKEGLVDTVPNKGFRVTAVSDRQLDEYTHIRSHSGADAVAGAAQHVSEGGSPAAGDPLDGGGVPFRARVGRVGAGAHGRRLFRDGVVAGSPSGRWPRDRWPGQGSPLLVLARVQRFSGLR